MRMEIDGLPSPPTPKLKLNGTLEAGLPLGFRPPRRFLRIQPSGPGICTRQTVAWQSSTVTSWPAPTELTTGEFGLALLRMLESCST